MKKQKTEKDEVLHERRFAIQFDMSYQGVPGKKMDGSSQTLPDQSITVRHMLQDHVRGKDGNVRAMKPLHFDHEVPVLRDLSDIDNYRDHLQEKLRQTDEFIAREEARKAEEEERARAVEAASKLRDSVNNQENESETS